MVFFLFVQEHYIWYSLAVNCGLLLVIITMVIIIIKSKKAIIQYLYNIIFRAYQHI